MNISCTTKEPQSRRRQERQTEKSTALKGQTVVTASTKERGAEDSGFVGSNNDLLGRYEKGDKQFDRYEIGDKIVYFHQRMIDDATVEGDYIRYQFDRHTKELLNKGIHWRDDLTEHLPAVISQEHAESLLIGEVRFSKLYIISPESYVFPIKPTPKNPCWVVTTRENDNVFVVVIDAVKGRILGHGVPPPSV